MSQADVEQKAALALHLQEQDDALLCAFGPNYFDGVRKGAACGAVFTACLSRLTYINLREDFKEHEASIPKHMRRGAWTVSRGFKTRPFFTLGCISLALTSLMKSVKFVLANYRYQEFVADDIGFQLLEEMYANSPMGREEIGKLLDDAFKNLNSINVLTPNNNVKSHDPMQTSLTNKLIQKASPRAEQRPPSFWDGVAVGLMGSIMDSYLPSKPLYCYYDDGTDSVVGIASPFMKGNFERGRKKKTTTLRVLCGSKWGLVGISQMVVFLMGKPRSKHGAPAIRPILFMLQEVSYPSSGSTFTNICNSSNVSRSFISDSMGNTLTSQGTGLIPLRRQSNTDAIDEVFGAERLAEIQRQKETMFQAFLRDIDNMADMMSSTLKGFDASLVSESTLSVSRQLSPWKYFHTPSSLHTGRACVYVHESPISGPLAPCRHDLIYASEKNRTPCLGNSSKQLRIELLSLKPPPLDADMYAIISLEEMITRHDLLRREERHWGRLKGEEVATFLRVQLSIRTHPNFHRTKLSSLAGMRRKELKYFEDSVLYRTKKQEEEHRAFMHDLPKDRLPPLKIPTLTPDGKPYRCAPVDYEIARALAVEKRAWVSVGRRKKNIFPSIL